MDRFDRIYALHKLLSTARYPVSKQQILQTLECSPSTFMRDVKLLRDYLGAPLIYHTKANGWYYDEYGEHPYELPGLWFNAQELYALSAINKLIHDLQPGFLDEKLRPVQKRIDKILQTKQLGSGELPSRVRTLAIGFRKTTNAFQKIAEAVLQRKQIKLHYHARSNDETTERIISPQRLVHYRDNWYLDAWCYKRNGLRSFSVDRIKQIKLLPEIAEDIDEASMQDYFADAYGIFAGKADKTAILVFNTTAARWVSEESWHPNQQGQFLENGQYQLRLPYGNPKELIMDILKYGADVDVKAPEELRQAVHEQLNQALKHYRKK